MKSTQLYGLGFTVPAWLKNIAGAIVRGTKVTVPTPVGPQTFDLSDPRGAAALEQLREALAKAQFSYATPPPSSAQGAAGAVQSAVAQIPGGWATIGLGALILLGLTRMRRA